VEHIIIYKALAILCVNGQIPQAELDGSIIAGELALDDNLRTIKEAINTTQNLAHTVVLLLDEIPYLVYSRSSPITT
jgi:hypothetical protein